MKIIIKNHQELQESVDYLVSKLKLEIKKDLIIEVKIAERDGYHIQKQQGYVTITYFHKHHFFAALMKVMSLSNETSYESYEQSHFDDLGLMLDTARNAVPQMDTIKKYIMILSLLGYNYLELYVEDVMEVKEEPFYGYMRGKYAISDIKYLDEFSKKYGIELIPCIQTLAHLDGLFKHPEYREVNDIDDILLVGHPKTYQLIENILKTTKEAFTSKKINIGMDEAWKLGLGKYLSQNGFQNRLEIMKNHLERVLSLCKKYQYQPSMWADMFFHLTTGSYHQEKVEFSQDVIDQIPKDVQLIYWDYYRTEKAPYQNKYDSLKQLTKSYAFAGGAWKWIGFTPHNLFTMRSMKPAIEVAIENGVKDFLLTAWGDNGAEAAQFSIIPSLLYISDLSYQKEDRQSFAALLTGYTYDELLKLDLPDLLYHHDAYTPTNPSKYLLFEDVLMGHRQISVEKNYKTYYKQHAKILKPLSEKTSKYSYLFRTMHDLADLLSIKSTLSLEIYQAYHAKDRDQFKKLISRLKKVIKKTNVFYETFKTQWFYENKPFGFEIQTYRFGGLLLRLEEVQKILEAYVNGDLSHISELDERILTPKLNKQYNGTIYFNQFINYISYSKL